MRIISGRFKGRRLKAFQLPHIRPTLDQVKETLFNKLMFDIPNTKVLDLFSGTGNLGIEALSRGAEHVTFVDDNKKSIQLLRENLNLLKIPSTEYRVVHHDAFKFIKQNEQTFDVIFVDPPFPRKWADKALSTIAQNPQTFHASTLIAIEATIKEQALDHYPPFKLLDRRLFGDKNLLLYAQDSDLSGKL